MACPDQLVTKNDLSDLATKAQADEILAKLQRIEVGTDTTIPGAIANIIESLASIIRDPLVAAIEGSTSIVNNAIDSIENGIISAINAAESVLNNAINSTENVLLEGIQATQNIVASIERSISAGFATINNGIDSVREVALAGFSTLNNAINSARQVILSAISAVKTIMLETLETVKAIAPYIRDIVLGMQDFLARLIEQYSENLRAILEALPGQFPELNFDDGAILSAIQGVDGKLGSYPLSCDGTPISYSGSVADAFELLLCGGRSGGGSNGSNGSDGDDGNDLSNLADRALLEAIADAIGVNEFPGEVPKTLLNSGDNPESSGTTEIPNLTQFVLWIVKQMDSLIGEFPVKIKIKDADLVDEGNQELNIEVRNIAEALGDVYGHGASSLIVQNAQTNILLRLAAEAVSIKTATLINQDLAIANQEFMGYRTKRKKRDADSAFNIAKADPNNIKSLSQILQSGKYKYQGFEFDDSAVLLEYLPKFMFAASIIKSVHLRTDEADIDSLQDLASDTLADADNGWNNFVDEVNNPESFLNLNEPDRPFIRDFNDEDAE